ncbi:hypothetical protein IIC68_03985, partial [archaeon]|nr:hypothetical protein [archaeon]
MEDNKPEEQSSESSAENQESNTTETNTSEGNEETEENKKEPFKLKIPSFKVDLSGVKNIYEGQYKKLLILPIALLIIAILIIGLKVATTGEFISKDVSLNGGITVTVQTAQEVDILQLKNVLLSRFPANDILTKSLSRFGTQVGVIVEADVEQQQLNSLLDEIGKALNRELTTQDYTVEIVGSSLGASFFKEIVTALLIAFVLMAIVVFIYFRTIIPSAAVILAVFSDIIITVA